MFLKDNPSTGIYLTLPGLQCGPGLHLADHIGDSNYFSPGSVGGNTSQNPIVRFIIVAAMP